MNDIPPENVQYERPTPSSLAEPASPPQRSRKALIIAIVTLVVLSCVCLGICVAAGGWGIITGTLTMAREKDNVTAVLDDLFQAMAHEDAEAAYALFSTRSQRTTSLADVEKLLQGNNLVLFDGYLDLTLTNLSIKKAINTNPDLPQGTIAEVSAAVLYKGGFTGQLTSVLEQEDDGWMVFSFRITVPPDKFDSP
jgi:hypothetical protein